MGRSRGRRRLPGTAPGATRRNVLVWLLYLYVAALLAGLVWSLGVF